MYDFNKTQPKDERFGTYNEGLGICPFMSRQSAYVFCTKDCAIMDTGFKCPFKNKNSYSCKISEIK